MIIRGFDPAIPDEVKRAEATVALMRRLGIKELADTAGNKVVLGEAPKVDQQGKR